MDGSAGRPPPVGGVTGKEGAAAIGSRTVRGTFCWGGGVWSGPPHTGQIRAALSATASSVDTSHSWPWSQVNFRDMGRLLGRRFVEPGAELRSQGSTVVLQGIGSVG